MRLPLIAVIAGVSIVGLSGSFGCDDTLEKRETTKVREDGTVVKDREEVRRRPDGTIIKEEEHTRDNPNR